MVFAGEAGQGIQTIEYSLPVILKHAGYNVFATKEYMSRIRGGTNSTEIRIGTNPIASYVNRMDIFFPLDPKAVERLKNRITDRTIIVGDMKKFPGQENMVNVPMMDIATEVGNPIYSNTVALGFIAGFLNVEDKIYEKFFSDFFAKKGEEIVKKNIEACKRGWVLGDKFSKEAHINLNIDRRDLSHDYYMDGHKAVTIGAIAGGCNFISSYPMSPSTGVLTQMAKGSERFGVLVEQAEDEISAINMALGSWYAGGRAIVTTSGGGFSLMTEGLSLAGCIESPIVIHLGQRPGPATGLPTRTEQGDLDLALFSGHGEFPRVIYAPGTLADAMFCTYKAFDVADKYQVPVFVLTDQFLLDSAYNFAKLPVMPKNHKHRFIETDANYKRYQITDEGVSPRGIPGFGKGIVCVDSDEHNEGGYITEDFDMRIAMTDKRLKKERLLRRDCLKPELYGNKNFRKLLIGWGSSFAPIVEALEHKNGNANGTAFLYFKQVYPVPEVVTEYWAKAKEVVIIENNATGQFEKLLKREYGLSADRHVRKYNGLPFSVEDIFKQI